MIRVICTSGSDGMFLNELAVRVSPEERRVARAIFDIDLNVIDPRRSRMWEQKDFLACAVVSADDVRCPFEIHLGRGESDGHFNFYVGLGGEMYNYESLGAVRKQDELANDIELFLRSRIECEMYLKGGAAFRADYRGDIQMSDGLAFRARYHSERRFVFWGYRKEKRQYEPWLAPKRQ